MRVSISQSVWIRLGKITGIYHLLGGLCHYPVAAIWDPIHYTELGIPGQSVPAATATSSGWTPFARAVKCDEDLLAVTSGLYGHLEETQPPWGGKNTHSQEYNEAVDSLQMSGSKKNAINSSIN